MSFGVEAGTTDPSGFFRAATFLAEYLSPLNIVYISWIMQSVRNKVRESNRSRKTTKFLTIHIFLPAFVF